MPDNQRAQCALIRQLMFLSVDKDSHHFVVVDIWEWLIQLSSLLLQIHLRLQLWLETHYHVHTVTIFLMVDKEMLRLAF